MSPKHSELALRHFDGDGDGILGLDEFHPAAFPAAPTMHRTMTGELPAPIVEEILAKYADVVRVGQLKMNGEPLPRDHGFPLRVIIPGYVGARSVKWLDRIVATRSEVPGTHQTGIAYKQLGPNQKLLSEVPKEHIHALPPIDTVPIMSAITTPEPGAAVSPGDTLMITGYAYSGAGCAVIRVDVSVDGGKTWSQAELTRAAETQEIRSGRAWAWVQWRHTATVPADASGSLTVVCKAVDDQYNQQPHEAAPIWNIRGILNTSWGRAVLPVAPRAKL